MKVLRSIVILLGYLAVIVAANIAANPPVFGQSSVKIATNVNSEQVQSTTVSIDRADLTQPCLLRVQASANNVPIQMQRVEVKVNGKVFKSIANNSLELNLAPLMKIGKYEIEISGSSHRIDDTISVNLIGKNTNITQQVSGSGKIEQILIINVQ
jgi:hypothetical protein